MTDPQCHDCDNWLNNAGWIVTPDYPATDTVVGMVGKVLICDRCLVARVRRAPPPQKLPRLPINPSYSRFAPVVFREPPRDTPGIA